ncbi:CD226 antigen isoform X2 [Ranitomeya variabilis]|uniref:CD226 antigen isoform X2 n=1 Tax=Ranitomeya variabilis TaxID=490064 RepID=UPI004055D40C
MKITFGLFLLHMLKTVHLQEMVDTTLILRRTITLDCKYSGNNTIMQLHWAKVNGSSEEAMCSVHKSYGKYISPKYMSRLSFVLENSSSDLSIMLRETSDADIGIYVCYVVVYPTGTLKKVIAVQAGVSPMRTFALIWVSSLLVIVGIFTTAALCIVRTRKKKRIQAKQVNVSFNSTCPQLKMDTVDMEHTYANFIPNF